MTLRVEVLPAPAVGTDWRYVIPAQYVEKIVAVSAQLTTLGHPTIAADSSGNGRNMTYNGAGVDMAWGAVGPFGGTPDNAVSICETTGSDDGFVCRRAASTDFDTANVTIEAYVWPRSINGPSRRIWSLSHYNAGNPQDRYELILNLFPGTPELALWNGNLNVVWAFSLGAVAGSWVHVAATWDGANWNAYKNGVLLGTTAGGGPSAQTNTTAGIGGYVDNSAFGTNSTEGRIAAVAVYGTPLAAANLAAHVAANTSAANYKAAVLLDVPLGLWMLDETDQHGARIANLEITDGTNVVADYPGLSNANTGANFTWTWAVNAPGSALGGGGTTNFVQIPDLILPGGYTVGTKTPGLTALDQWSNVHVWWDDTAMPGGGLGSIIVPPYLDAFLVPDYTQGVPR